MPTTLRIANSMLASNVDGLLRSDGGQTTVVAYQPKDIVFSQGDPSDSVMYLQEGTVRLSVSSERGQEGIVAILEAGAFFGESALVDDPARHETATAMAAATVLIIPKAQMKRLYHGHDAFRDRFIAHMLVRNIRLEEDLVDQLFNSSEKRLARALLLLANYDHTSKTHRVRLPITQQALADMVGTTRSRVSLFLTRFKKHGYIEYGGGLTVNDSLRRAVLPNEPLRRSLPKTA